MLKNSDMMWTPEMAVVADVGTFITKLAAAVKAKGLSFSAEWTTKLKDKDIAKEKANYGERCLRDLLTVERAG